MAGIKGKQIETGADGVGTANLVDGILSADVAGRAKQASGYYNEATFTDKVAAAAITAAKLKTAGETYDLTGTTAVRVPAPVIATDAATKQYVDTSVASNVSWQAPANLMYYIGTRTVAQIDALTPSAGWSVVAGDAGTPAAGASDPVATGDMVEFDGTSWLVIIPNAGGFPPAGSRAVVAWPDTATLYGPLVDDTDEGKIADWDGLSLTPALTTSMDGWALLCKGSTPNPPVSFYENLQFIFSGVVPTGSWNQLGGSVPLAPVGEITTVNAGDAASAGVSSAVTRGDHQHAVATATAVDAGTANAEGVSTSLARADHVHRVPRPYIGDKSRAPAATSGNYSTTGITITVTPALGGNVTVFANGIRAKLGDGNRDDLGDFTNNVECYFSADGGTTARAINAIVAGDTLYWNGTHAGYDLLVTDQIDLDYQVL